jgi:putative transposase
MKKKVPVVTVASADDLPELHDLPTEVTIALSEIASCVREGLLAFASSAGLLVMRQMMEAELTASIGEKHTKIPPGERTGNWHGTTQGPVALGGRIVTIERPRGRTIHGDEINLETWRTFSSTDLLNSLVVERMLAGVATRRHSDVSEPMGSVIERRSRSTSKSAVSRRFVKATEKAMADLMARSLSDLDVAVIMIDGTEVAGQCCVVALVITGDGTKVPVGLWLGDTENKTVVTAFLADLVDRGLDFSDGILCVIDGAKALAAGIKRVFGDKARVQRCTIHKRRNVRGHLPKELAHAVDKRLAVIFSQPDEKKGLDAATRLAKELEADHPDAAASLREGLEDMFTARRLGVTPMLAKNLTNTNCIESMISISERTTRRVTRWKDGQMKKRWIALGMLEAERSFRKIKGYKDVAKFVDALRRDVTRSADRPVEYDHNAA